MPSNWSCVWTTISLLDEKRISVTVSTSKVKTRRMHWSNILHFRHSWLVLVYICNLLHMLKQRFPTFYKNEKLQPTNFKLHHRKQVLSAPRSSINKCFVDTIYNQVFLALVLMCISTLQIKLIFLSLIQ